MHIVERLTHAVARYALERSGATLTPSGEEHAAPPEEIWTVQKEKIQPSFLPIEFLGTFNLANSHEGCLFNSAQFARQNHDRQAFTLTIRSM
jgi:hypothetical protein